MTHRKKLIIALFIFPNHNTLIKTGDDYAAKGQYQERIENCDLVIKYKPDYSEAYSNKAFVLNKLGRAQ